MVGLDINEEEGKKTEAMVRDLKDGKIRSLTVSTGFVRTALALNQIPAQARQRGITPEEVVHHVMLGDSRVKEMMSPIEVANLFLFGFSRSAKYLVGGDLLFDGGNGAYICGKEEIGYGLAFFSLQATVRPERVFCSASARAGTCFP